MVGLKAFLKTEGAKTCTQPSDEVTKANTEETIKQSQEMFKVSKFSPNLQAPVQNPDGGDEAVAAVGFLPDLQADAKIWSLANIGFG